MSDSVPVKQAILEANIGRDVTIILKEGGQSNVFQGVLGQEHLPDGLSYWVLISPRGIVRQHGTPVPVPETQVMFPTDQLSHIVVKMETAEEALEKIQKGEQDEGSKLVGPDGGMLQ
jgi:hypothetical protein